MNHLIGLVVALLGGSGVVLGLGIKYGLMLAEAKLPGLLGVALLDLENHQKVKQILEANRPALEALISSLDATAKGNLDSLK